MPLRQRPLLRHEEDDSFSVGDRDGGDLPPPPQMPDMAQFWANAIQYLTTMMTVMPRQGEQNETVGCSSTNFFGHNSPVFNGSGGPLAADNWITNFQDLTDTLRCTDSQRVDYAGPKLYGEANYWWKATKILIAEELGLGVPIPWDRFKREFNDRFFHRAQRRQCAREFQDLKQGNKLVEQYSAEFLKLLSYAPHLIPDEQTKVERFLDGLLPRFKEMIAFLDITSYTKMVHTATIAEKGIREVAADYVNRKRSMSSGVPPPPLPPSKRQSFGSSFRSYGRKNAAESRASYNVTKCNKCGRQHPGPCRFGMCFRCGKPGHHIRNCPTMAVMIQGSQASNNQSRQPARAWVHSLIPDNVEAEENVIDVVTGTIPLFGSVACILFDSGAIHSFVSSTFVKLCNLSTEPLKKKICVATVVGDVVTCRKCVDDCPIVIERKTLPAKLAVFSMLDFDVILEWIGYQSMEQT